MKPHFVLHTIKPILLLALLFSLISATAQVKKIQIGKSVVIKNQTVVADSMITTNVYFDNQDRILREWRIGRNGNGNIEDTSILHFDTFRNVVYSSCENHFSFRKFDQDGKEMEWKIISPNYTNQMFYSYTYDSIGRVAAKSGTDGKEYFASTEAYNYQYNEDTIIEYSDYISRKYVKNVFNRIIFDETIVNIDSMRTSNAYTQQFDSIGNLLTYTRYENGIATKITRHFYIDNIEDYMVEEFLAEDFKIITKFQFINWD
jgi:hypothetical protein